MVLISTTTATVSTLLLFVTLFLPSSSARPHDFVRDRRSGISDQRLAELETLLSISKLKGYRQSYTRPIGFGVIDANKIGRRKRNSRRKRHDPLKSVLLVLPSNEDEKRVQESSDHYQESAETKVNSFYQDIANDIDMSSRFTLRMSSSMPSVYLPQTTNDEDDEADFFLE